ncbi:MAG: hypothetical protein K0R26_2261 [Bacteroidota bacterium]|jgi:hypothetical protein|nr:hypothetical protein [Bacteroidota bacterium]
MKQQHAFTLCGEQLNGPIHICALFHSVEEQHEVLIPWLKEGLVNKEQVFIISESACHDGYCTHLKQEGIQTEEAMATNQLKIVASEDTYINGGNFSAEKMYETLEGALKETHDGPYGKCRGLGDMEWAAKCLPGTDDLIEYEARINAFIPKYQSTIICCYDINKFSGSAIGNILAAHPYAIMNGRLHKNPYYIEPFELLQKLIKRPKTPLTNGYV